MDKNRIFKAFSVTVRGIALAQSLIIGSFLAYKSVSLLGSLLYDISWRMPKGYLVWELHASQGAIAISLAMFSLLCFILATTVFRWQWTRRTTRIVVGVSVAGVVAFIVAIGIFVVTFPARSDF